MIQKKPLIQVIETFNESDRDQSDDDGPPEIIWNSENIAFSHQEDTHELNQTTSSEGPSLMEQMMDEGLRAKHELDVEKIKQNRRQSKSSSFAALKKGFLSATTTTTKTTTTTTTTSTTITTPCTYNPKPTTGNELVNDDKDSMILMPTFQKNRNVHDKTTDHPLIKPKQKNLQENHPLHLPEVQEQMDKEMSPFLSNTSQWMTPHLMDKVSQNPALLSAMSDPSFTATLQAMIRNPQLTTMELQKSKPQYLLLIKEFCSLLGDHFTQLGEQEKSLHSHNHKNREAGSNINDIKDISDIKDINELVVTKKNRDSEQENVQKILADESLKNLLLDSDMQHVMKECTLIPGRFQMYMQHPIYGPNLRKMIHAGLLTLSNY